VVVVVNDKTGRNLPIVVNNNILMNSEIDHRAGRLTTSPETE
jgi:hypothetical protein